MEDINKKFGIDVPAGVSIGDVIKAIQHYEEHSTSYDSKISVEYVCFYGRASAVTKYRLRVNVVNYTYIITKGAE